MSSEIKPGDIVRLKSGGPDMVVEAVDVKLDFGKGGTHGGWVRCNWFAFGDDVKADLFLPVVLVKKEDQS